jgi:GT2 family glycosyltransferase
MVRRKLFEKAGKFNEGYGVGTFEDAELCLQIRKLGLRVFIYIEAIGTHYTGATAQALQRVYPIQKNLMTFKACWVASGLLQWTWEIY